MIVTLTPNPSLDRALDVEHVELGEVNRAVAAHTDPGGKGINVSRALVAQGVASVAVLPVGGADGAHLTALLAEVGVPAVAVPVSGATRSNFTLAEIGGATTKVNAPGHVLSDAEVGALLDAVDAQLALAPRALVGAGSLPAGAGDDLYARVGALAARHGVPYVLDTSGTALTAAVAAGGVELVKPNDEELAELVGRDLVTVGDVVGAASEVIARGTRAVLVSLGSHGALLVRAEGTWWAGGAPLVAASTVGAGDTTLAGYLAAEDPATDPATRLRTAVAWGRAAVLLPGTATPTPADVHLDEVRVVVGPDPRLALKEL
ncbi:1-phosphofructokinase family hexose kinase [Cellulomonas marina]|uniref:1-phosphofructokinase n=1 Tax=Cellulomonas marina TaxID=988821 RepID=A0A1I0XQJ1_9CELL|nr:1-phosphofructokinase family hexose kinase [Cellulomonas marina]GIG30021.1 1-phosphofructokinase [Cellulomonas marina]SFB03409.1 1-phosphofructokinase [Cellulomonas marina]